MVHGLYYNHCNKLELLQLIAIVFILQFMV